MARAGLLCLVLALHAVASCPLERLDDAARGSARAASASSAGAELLASLGVRTTSARVLEVTARVVDVWSDAQAAVMTPLAPAFDALQVHQRWGLFTTAPVLRWRLDVEARDGERAPWRLLYRAHDPRHRWRADQLEYRRLRGAWNPTDLGPTESYPRFTRWVARRVFADDGRATAARIRMVATTMPAPGARASSVATGSPDDAVVVRRGEEGPP